MLKRFSLRRPRSRESVVRALQKICSTNEKGCWLLPGGDSNSSGHKRVQYQNVTYGAHEFFYETLVGPVPPGLVLDHTCCETSCVNPKHLDPCTRGENTRRAKQRLTVCKAGHPLSGENLYMRPDGYRACRTCQRSRNRKHEEKKKEAKSC